MSRYFIEVAYLGTNYSGFQKQDNGNTIQAEVEKALSTYFRCSFDLTGSSRTDAGVHAFQNFFHFDTDIIKSVDNEKVVYRLNAILPLDIVVKSIKMVSPGAHCRFDALSRTYEYHVYQQKNPFKQSTAFYYPYTINARILQDFAAEVTNHNNFEAFCKKNTQVHSFLCNIYKSEWKQQNDAFIYTVTANRFLRGMVKGLVGTMLHSVRNGLGVREFRNIITSQDRSLANFAVPSHGLILKDVQFNDKIVLPHFL